MHVPDSRSQTSESLFDPDVGLGTDEFIISRGFISEFHPYYSTDGYQTSMHRIVHPFQRVYRYPVLMITIDGGTGVEWLRNSPGGCWNESTLIVGPNLGFELAKRGYDVWLLNYRGAPAYCNKHVTLDLDHDLEYWDFSLDDMAFFDLPVAIDYVRHTTGFRKIGMVAHATSNTMYFFLASRVPKYNDIVQPYIGLAPSFSQAHNSLASMPLEDRMAQIDSAKIKRGQYYPTSIARLVIQNRLICRDKISAALVCNPFLYATVLSQFGNNAGSINYDRLTVYATVGAGYLKSSWQYAQELSTTLSDRVTMFNVTPEVNLQRYGTVTPPEYLPEMITNSEMHFISSQSDRFADPEDLGDFIQRLGTRLRSHRMISTLR